MLAATSICFLFVMKRSGENENKSGLSESFVIGVIAIVFLVVGYQTALFIHRAAVTKIVAGRDHPDTVYVYAAEPDVSDVSADKPQNVTADQKTVGKSVRKNSEHSPRVEAVRANVPARNVENFRFDPNEVSVNDLCRLGFSARQAQAIDNYRRKGGRFHRKSDFAESYVVSDSVFRRLEPYIDIPLLDLNLADSAAFDALPGIGGWFAAKMVEHREMLGGYSYKEQLMDIYRFDRQKFDALSDLVVVSPEHVTPYPLWSLPADSLRRHPYIRNYETANAIVLFRQTTPDYLWTIGQLATTGILSSENMEKLSLCKIQIP